jgi:DnaJ-class molecular chaperone
MVRPMTTAYYDILEVSPRATTQTIRAAFKSLMQRHHPDKCCAGNVALERTRQLLEAYEVLANADRRAAYDRKLLEQPAQKDDVRCAATPDPRVLRALAIYSAHASVRAPSALYLRI